MTDLFSWNVTIIGALLCLLYCWFLAVLGRSQKVRFGKVVPVLGIVGTFVLAGMAYVGPLHNPKSEGVHPMNDTVVVGEDPEIVEARRANRKHLSLVRRTRTKLGPRPSGDHVAWEYPDGKLAWVTKDEYLELRREQRKGEK